MHDVAPPGPSDVPAARGWLSVAITQPPSSAASTPADSAARQAVFQYPDIIDYSPR
jgi:hypothetical protein